MSLLRLQNTIGSKSFRAESKQPERAAAARSMKSREFERLKMTAELVPSKGIGVRLLALFGIAAEPQKKAS